jgi:hypothetical protein
MLSLGERLALLNAAADGDLENLRRLWKQYQVATIQPVYLRGAFQMLAEWIKAGKPNGDYPVQNPDIRAGPARTQSHTHHHPF